MHIEFRNGNLEKKTYLSCLHPPNTQENSAIMLKNGRGAFFFLSITKKRKCYF